MKLGRDWIEAHIPHRGAMCLLDGVLEWDARHIVCRASSHRDAANPMRIGGTLPAAFRASSASMRALAVPSRPPVRSSSDATPTRAAASSGLTAVSFRSPSMKRRCFALGGRRSS